MPPRKGRPAANGPARRTSRDRWLVPVLLATPFIAMVAALRGLTATLPIFHGSDERVYQYPTILRFSRQLPFPDLHNYNAAQTPLFHLLMAYAGRVVGFQLWRLRLIEVVISYLLALAVFGLLHRRVGIERMPALALTLLFALSPYVFGTSFRLMTDNLALLFSVLALERFERFRESERLSAFLVGCVCAGAAVLTRQSTAFLFGVAGLYVLLPSELSRRRRLAAWAAIAASALPAALLFLSWHGLVPPGGDPSSCGLCSSAHAAAGAHAGTTTSTGLQLRTAELALATIGLYGAVLFAPRALLALGRRGLPPSGRRGLLFSALAGVILLLVFPATPGPNAAGAIWRVARDVPSVDGSSLVFWVLVPVSGVVLWLRLRVARHPWAVVVFTACFLLSALVIRFPWQKYVDPFALLILLLTVRARELSSPRLLAGAAVLATAFIAYTVDLSAHRPTPVPRSGQAYWRPAVSAADELIDNNRAYAEVFDQGDAPAAPARKLAVITCMDARVNVYAMLGLREGDAHVIRNAGGVITADEIRSLAISQRLLGTEEIMVIHHTGCGMLSFTDDEFSETLERETGVKPDWSAESFRDLDADVRQSIARVQASPFIPHKDAIRGFVYEVETGRLREVS